MAKALEQPLVKQTLEEEVRRRQEEAGADYEVSLESLSQWQLAWRKFRKHRLALVGMGVTAGVDPTHYGPAVLVTREQVAVFLIALENVPAA